MATEKSKRKKDFPCIHCDKHVKKTDYAVQCALCELWVHKDCGKFSDETYKVLDMQNEATGMCFWSCKSCTSFGMKFEKRMRDFDKRMNKLETEVVKELTYDVEGIKGNLKELTATTEKYLKV